MVRLALAMVWGILLPVAVQRFDRRRMSVAMRARTWNGATWGAAVYAFGPLSMLGWFWVTRPRGARVWKGALAAGATLACVEFIDFAFVRLVLRASADGGSSLTDVSLAFAATTAFGVVLLGLFELAVAVRARMH